MKSPDRLRVVRPIRGIALLGLSLGLTGCTMSVQPDEAPPRRVYAADAPPPPPVVDRGYEPAPRSAPVDDRGYDSAPAPAARDTYSDADEPPPYVPPPQEAYTTYEQDLNPYGHWVQVE